MREDGEEMMQVYRSAQVKFTRVQMVVVLPVPGIPTISV